ncbi:MAG: DUF2959 domain-containing protein [Planctomycetota bacterium]
MAVSVAGLAGCESAGIVVREQLGYEKREQLVDRVESARDEQQDAKEQFATTLEEFKSLTDFDGGDLEKTYNRLSRELKRSEDAASDVGRRIDAVEAVGDRLFSEWNRELDEYTSAELRRASEDQLRATQSQYDALLSAMRRAESRMAPVLASFNEQVLFLKHNLNARAIASLESTTLRLENEIDRLVAEMEASIAEADAFIQDLRS